MQLITLAMVYSFLNCLFCYCQIEYGSNDGRHILIDNTRIYYEEYGSGTTLLLLHGGTSSISTFSGVIPVLSSHFKIIAIDSPGHGRSEQADSLSYQLMANYVSQLIDIMDFDSVYIIGHSDGGNTALLLAHDRPDKVKRIIVSGANSNIHGITKEALNLFESLDPQYVESQMQDWLTNYKEKSPQKDDWKKFIIDEKKMLLEDTIISSSKLRNIQGRTLVVMGDRDWYIKLEHGVSLYTEISGSELCVLPNTPHNPYNSKPELISEIALDFLKAE